MRFSTTTLLALAAPLLAFAQTNSTSGGPNAFAIPQGGYTGNAGDVTTINWNPTTTGTVTIVLRSGASSNLIAGTVVASSIPNSGSFDWTVPSDITRGTDYALEIVDDADPTVNNFTPQFVIESPNTVASTTNPVTLGTATGSASASGSTSSSGTDSMMSSSTGSAASASTTGSMSMTGSSSGSASGSATMSTSASRSSGASASASASDAVLTTTSAGSGARATAMAGMLGVVALGALVL